MKTLNTNTMTTSAIDNVQKLVYGHGNISPLLEMAEGEKLNYEYNSTKYSIYVASYTYSALSILLREEEYTIDKFDTGEFSTAIEILRIVENAEEFNAFFNAVKAIIVAKIVSM